MKRYWKSIVLFAAVFVIGMICLYFCYFHQMHPNKDKEKNDTSAFVDHKIDWKDENVELAIRTMLSKYNVDIYLSDVYDIKSLTLQGKDIRSIEDLSLFKNLYSLTLRDTSVEDLSPLAELQKLTELLIFGGGKQQTIDSLTGLTDLKRLAIYDSDINNIEAVRDLKNLTEFFMNNCNMNNQFGQFSCIDNSGYGFKQDYRANPCPDIY